VSPFHALSVMGFTTNSRTTVIAVFTAIPSRRLLRRRSDCGQESRSWRRRRFKPKPIPSGSRHSSGKGTRRVIDQQIALIQSTTTKGALASNSRKQIRMYSQLVHPPAVTQEPQRNLKPRPPRTGETPQDTLLESSFL
jgi:hypothetical protein